MGGAGKPLVVDVKRNALDDGPGIRSVVFFKGCPLRCVWCQNPESLRADAELLRDEAACVGCGTCQPACPQALARPAAAPQTGCQACGACVDACPAAARRIAGEPLDPAALAASLLRDAPFYRRSGGGVTLSGGEPALFAERVGALAARLRAAGVHVLLETCGHFAWDPFADHLLPQLASVYFDLKISDPAAHQRWTGVGNAKIHANLSALSQTPVEVLPRVALIPGLTDGDANLRALAERVVALGFERMALLPYNPTWLAKRRSLGLELPYAHQSWMSAEHIARCEATVAAAGLQPVR
jgi:pyruvate formate lyase activating enzyme